MNRFRLLALLSLGLLLVTGCHGPCRQLSEKLCECSENSIQKEACLRRVSSEESRVAPTPEQEQVCADLLPGCDCHNIDTAEGKRACGLAK
jgi:hypothetical protein